MDWELEGDSENRPPDSTHCSLKASKQPVDFARCALPGNTIGEGTEVWPTAARTVPSIHQPSFLLLVVFKTYLGQAKWSLTQELPWPSETLDGNGVSENEKMRRVQAEPQEEDLEGLKEKQPGTLSAWACKGLLLTTKNLTSLVKPAVQIHVPPPCVCLY